MCAYSLISQAFLHQIQKYLSPTLIFFSIENPTGQDQDEEETKKKIAELVSSQDFFIEEGSIDFDNESEWSLDIPN